MPTIAKSVLYEFDVFQVVFDDADQMTDTFLLLLQMLKDKRKVAGDASWKNAIHKPVDSTTLQNLLVWFL